jgi:DNA-binding response OmpR family regulator
MKGHTFMVLPKPFDIHELMAAVRSCIASQKEIEN